METPKYVMVTLDKSDNAGSEQLACGSCALKSGFNNECTDKIRYSITRRGSEVRHFGFSVRRGGARMRGGHPHPDCRAGTSASAMSKNTLFSPLIPLTQYVLIEGIINTNRQSCYTSEVAVKLHNCRRDCQCSVSVTPFSGYGAALTISQ